MFTVPKFPKWQGQHRVHSRRLMIYTGVLALFWTLLLAASFDRDSHLHQQEVLLISRGEAQAALDRDNLYRIWATRHGGVYVPISPTTQPNPFLSHVPERDITTPSGKALTLLNPAYMTRQVYELAKEQGMVGRGHLTSLNALRPENRPDKWEEQALKAFEKGVDEVSAVQVMEGQKYIRLMRPFVTEQPCLKCHAHQGYKAGDIRGGVSVSIPIARLQEATRQHVIEEGVIHGMLWLFGTVTLAVGFRQLNRSAGSLQEQARLLEEEIAERHIAEEQLAVKQLQLEALNQSLETRIAQAVDELRQKDDTLIQQGRLAAMGEMINNIAHQWRQPLNNLGLLIQNVELMEESGELTRESLHADVKDAMEMIMFMSHTIDDFRYFFRQDKNSTMILVKKQVATSLDFVAAMLKDNSISWSLVGEDDVTAVGYPNEFSQVLLNILNNARDALLERPVQRPCISVRVFNDKGRAVVTVADNAGGIAPEVLPKVFDPYFTTKEPGKGTGIGLYMSKVIIEKHMNGRLTVRNTDVGAEFRIEI